MFQALIAMPPMLFAASDAPATAESTQPRDPNGRGGRFLFGIGVEATADDNICQLSEHELRLFESGQGSKRCLIEDPQDTVTEGKLDFRWETRPFPRRETAVSGSLDAYHYVRSDIKDYQDIELGISQELTASRRHLALVRAEVEVIPDTYSRELTDDDASFAAGHRIRESATYSLTDYGLIYRQRIIEDRLESVLAQHQEIRNYNDFFPERDSTKGITSLDLQVRPFGRSRISVRGGYEGGRLEAEGDLPSTPILDDDISYRHQAAELETVFPWGSRRRGRLELSARGESREYTTDNSFDICHFERKDRRRDYRLRFLQRIASGLDLVAEARRKSNDPIFPLGFSSCEDDAKYVEDRVGVGLAWRVDFKKR